MAAVAAPSAFCIYRPNKRYCYHHHHHHHHQFLSSLSSPLFYSIGSAASIPATKTKLKAQLENSPFPSSDENPLGICFRNEELEVGSASFLGIIRKKMKVDKNHLCHRGITPILLSYVVGLGAKMGNLSLLRDARLADITANPRSIQGDVGSPSICIWAISCVPVSWFLSAQTAFATEIVGINAVYEVGELFELGIQLTYLLLLLSLLGVGSFFVIRQVLVRRELDLSAKELQEQVRSGDASAMGLFELGAVMLRRKFYPAAIKYLLQAIEKWDGDQQDLAQVYNALGVSYVLDGKVDKGIAQFENAVKLQPGYVTAWNNLGDAYEKKKEITLALEAFEEALLFDPNNKVARPRRDALSDKVKLYKGIPMKSKKTS